MENCCSRNHRVIFFCARDSTCLVYSMLYLVSYISVIEFELAILWHSSCYTCIVLPEFNHAGRTIYTFYINVMHGESKPVYLVPHVDLCTKRQYMYHACTAGRKLLLAYTHAKSKFCLTMKEHRYHIRGDHY